MIDIHTHILPGLDDGAQDLYDTIEMAVMAYESGTTDIVATPHCNIPGIFENYFGIRYAEAFRSAKRVLEKEQIPINLMPGMEVFATSDLPRLLSDGKIMTINRTKYVLMEFDFEEDPDFTFYILEKTLDVGARPIVAHAERYRFVQGDPKIVEKWREMGIRIQVNKGSFLGRFGSRARHTAYFLLDHGQITSIASDAHGVERRTTDMAEVYDLLLENYPEKYLELLFQINPRLICAGQNTKRFSGTMHKREKM